MAGVSQDLTGFSGAQARKAVVTLTDAFQGRSAQLPASQATPPRPVEPSLATSRSAPASQPERITAPSLTHERAFQPSSKPRPAPAAAQTISSPTPRLSEDSAGESLLDMALKECEDSKGKQSASNSLVDKEREGSNGKESAGESLLDMAMKARKDAQVKNSNGKDSNGNSSLDMTTKEREDARGKDSNGESLLDMAMKEREAQAAKRKKSPAKNPVGASSSATAGNGSKAPRKEGLLEEALRLRQRAIFTPRKASKAPVDSVRVRPCLLLRLHSACCPLLRAVSKVHLRDNVLVAGAE